MISVKLETKTIIIHTIMSTVLLLIKKRISMESLLAHAGLPLPSSSLSTIHNTIQNQPLSPSLDLATTFERPPDGNYGQDGLIYSRIHNPTRTLLEQNDDFIDTRMGFFHARQKYGEIFKLLVQGYV